MNQRLPPGDDDDLIRLYHAAGDLDGRGPSPAVGDAVRAHARVQDAARRQAVQSQQPVRPVTDTAANTSRWRLSMLASVAVLGLAGLLIVQFDRGTPGEKELARGPARLPPAADVATSERSAAKDVAPSESAAAKAVLPSALPPLAEAQRRPAAPAPAAAPLGRPAIGVERSMRAQDALRNESAPASADTGTSMKAEQAVAGAPPRATAAPATPSRAPAVRPRLMDADSALHRLAAAGTWPAFASSLAAGAPVDGRDAQGRTPLMVAAEAGQTEMVRQLLRAGADARLVDDAGRTALHWAQQSGRDDVVRLLVEAGTGADGAGR